VKKPVIDAPVPAKFEPLLSPRRYKGAYGGRGGAKSHFFAEEMVLRCYERATRAACVREIQKDLKESVRQLICDKIAKFKLGNYFQILEGEIRGANGSLIIFKGMQTYNAESIKSLEGYDIVWVEEAQSLSATSLRVLRPTIRKEGSELWFSWNPRHDTDPVDAFFRGAGKPAAAEAIAVEVNWPDNPWFPEVLKREKDHDTATDPEMALHVWGGGYLLVSEGAYFAKLIAQAEREGRIGHFSHNPSRSVVTAWDIGVDDYTAIWFVQDDGLMATVIDYYEASGDGPQQIVPEIMPELDDPELLPERLARLERAAPFRYEKHQLPHDVKVREWGGGAKSRVQTLMELKLHPIKVGVPSKDADKVAAIRALLPFVRFNNTRRVMLGVARLRRYSRRWNEAMQTYGDALHDINSHGASAFAEFAFNCSIVPEIPVENPPAPIAIRGYSDMTYNDLHELDDEPRRWDRI
jgi:phage terminase large subunit